MVEARHREPWHKRMDPHSDSGQLDSDIVDVEPVDAAAGDLATQQCRWFDLVLGFVIPQCLAGSLFETTQLICDPGKGMFGEEGTHGCFDGVDRSNEEMSRTHREVRYTEV